MKRRSLLLYLGGGFFFSSINRARAQASLYDSAVVDMVEAVVSLIESHGLDGAIVQSPTGIWTQKDSGLYVFVMDSNGYLYVHSIEQMIAVNIRRARDINGVQFIERIIQALPETGDSVWTEYYWRDPVDSHIRRKRVYSKKIGKLIVSSGYYLDQA